MAQTDKDPRDNRSSEKSRLNKEPTSHRERDREDEFEIAGNVRTKGEDPSPDDRDRGERSSREPAGPEDADRA